MCDRAHVFDHSRKPELVLGMTKLRSAKQRLRRPSAAAHVTLTRLPKNLLETKSLARSHASAEGLDVAPQNRDDDLLTVPLCGTCSSPTS
jgi:hypothetical protein